MPYDVYQRVTKLRAEFSGLAPSEGRKMQIVTWFSGYRQSFLDVMKTSLQNLSEAEIFQYLLKNYAKLSGVEKPIITEDFHVDIHSTLSLFGCRCNSYEFLLVRLDRFDNLFVRRKKDGVLLVANFHWWIRRILSGTHSADYRAFILISVFKYFVYDDMPLAWWKKSQIFLKKFVLYMWNLFLKLILTMCHLEPCRWCQWFSLKLLKGTFDLCISACFIWLDLWFCLYYIIIN